MHSEKIRKKKLFMEINKSLEMLKGVSFLGLKENAFIEYIDMQSNMIYFYSYKSSGEKIEIYDDCIVNKILKYFNDNLNYRDVYYISYEDLYFLEFTFTNFLDFIKSWKNICHNYDLTIFNKNKIFIVNDNEYDITIHYQEF